MRDDPRLIAAGKPQLEDWARAAGVTITTFSEIPIDRTHRGVKAVGSDRGGNPRENTVVINHVELFKDA